jgi:hypothetical protein
MDWQFGYNCTHFVPALEKCRVKIDRYNRRDDLLADKWLKTREIVVYTGWPAQELMDRIERGEVQAKRILKPKNPERDGYIRYRLRCAWDWDSCGMAVTGGMCEFFAATMGPHITCIADLRTIDSAHPNAALAPTFDEVQLIESQMSSMVSDEEAATADA